MGSSRFYNNCKGDGQDELRRSEPLRPVLQLLLCSFSITLCNVVEGTHEGTVPGRIHGDPLRLHWSSPLLVVPVPQEDGKYSTERNNNNSVYSQVGEKLVEKRNPLNEQPISDQEEVYNCNGNRNELPATLKVCVETDRIHKSI